MSSFIKQNPNDVLGESKGNNRHTYREACGGTWIIQEVVKERKEVQYKLW